MDTASTLVNLNVDITDEVSLRRVLAAIIEQVDIIVGVRGDADITLTSLDKDITAVEEQVIALETSVEELGTTVETNTAELATLANALESVSLGTLFYDFDDTAWGSFRGNGQFSALGSALTNAPFTPTGGTTYTIYVESYGALNSGVIQRILVEDTGTSLVAYYRTGDTFAIALTNGWTAL